MWGDKTMRMGIPRMSRTFQAGKRQEPTGVAGRTGKVFCGRGSQAGLDAGGVPSSVTKLGAGGCNTLVTLDHLSPGKCNSMYCR